jgi:hypothetical protein
MSEFSAKYNSKEAPPKNVQCRTKVGGRKATKLTTTAEMRPENICANI